VVSIRIASILCWISAIGFGVFCPLAIWNLLTGRGVPIVMGFPAYGGGPFERIGLPTTVPLLVAFLLVCIAEGVAGWLLWGGHRSGAVIASAALPFGGAFWWGFSLPFPPLLCPRPFGTHPCQLEESPLTNLHTEALWEISEA
jgi:hypothetical protein